MVTKKKTTTKNKVEKPNVESTPDLEFDLDEDQDGITGNDTEGEAESSDSSLGDEGSDDSRDEDAPVSEDESGTPVLTPEVIKAFRHAAENGGVDIGKFCAKYNVSVINAEALLRG